MSERRSDPNELLLGEWACLGILVQSPAHGFAVAARLKPDGDVGRVWSISRALTYRSLDHLCERALAREAGEEPGIAGGSRTILAPTRAGSRRLRDWLHTPVMHLRDLRSELLLKLVLANACGLDATPLLDAQRTHIDQLASGLLERRDPHDAVALWRLEAVRAAQRFLVDYRGPSA